MNKYIGLIIFSFIIISCDKEKGNPCDVLVDNVYQFPELPSDNDWTSEQIYEYLDLPEDICKCISTEGLIETCMNYPYLSLIWAGASSQSGYLLLKDKFRGFEELEEREDAGTYLLIKYKEMNPLDYNLNSTSEQLGQFSFNFFAFEYVFSQIPILSKLEDVKKIELVETCLNKYDSKHNDVNEIHSIATDGTIYILNNLMIIDNFIETSYSECVSCYSDSIINYSIEYLNHLRN